MLLYLPELLLTRNQVAIMTSYIPSLTLPSAVFANPAASILLPVALGTAVGFTLRRKSPYPSKTSRGNY